MRTPLPSEATLESLRSPLGPWELRRQYTFISPMQPTLRIAGQEAAPPPRTNLVVSQTERGESMDASPMQQLETFLREVQSNVPGSRAGPPEDFEFSDGRAGCCVEIEFQATPSQSLLQWHAFRVDDDSVTQFVVTRDREFDDDPDFELAIATVRRFGDRFAGSTDR